ncbi:APC family permease [Nocardioides sp. Kera G14]|uniref:APC family permease n=1 Tax=Nocardioides sp. Kera G14 TaxID=2884264 RepID=UPI001D0F886E|nr:APC family permease [Nocardioides sp. Kera G14]UDY22607.1 APC family permease [Nocardioides sp. Kera G14]
MTTARPDDLVVSADTAEETAKLQKHFGRSDIYFFLVCTLFGVDGLGTLAGSGGSGFTWLVLCLVFFAVPSSLILAELGAAYTEEGGPYVWVRMAFGHLVGAVNNFFYWITNPVWMGGTLVGTAIGGLSVFIHSGSDWSKPAWYVFGLIFIWAGALFAILSFRVGKWVATVGAFARFALLGVFLLTVLLYAAKHGVHGLGFSDYKPDFSSFVALVPLILFSLVGFELPSAAGEEMEDPARDVPPGIIKSVITTALLYGVPVLGILTVIPSDQVSGLDGFPSAVRQALTVFGGSVDVAGDGTVTASLSGFGQLIGLIMGILIAIVAFTSGLTWVMGSDRTLAVSCYDGAGPRYFGQFSARFGTPVRVNVLSGVMSTIVFVATLEITDGNAAKFFSVALNMAISTTLISYLFIFPAAWVLRHRRPSDPRPFRAPWLPALTIISTVAIVFCTIQILFPGLGDDWFGPDYIWDGWKHSERWTFFLTEFIPLLAFIAIAVGFWALGRAHIRRSEAESKTEVGAA